VKCLCRLKYEQETTKYEVDFLKQQIPLHIASHPFEKQSIANLPLLDDIHDPILRQDLYQQYKQTVEEGRQKMMAISLECANAQKVQCLQQFQSEMTKLWTMEKTLPFNQKLTKIMQNLIEQRLENIAARVQCLYKFKSQLLHAKQNFQ